MLMNPVATGPAGRRLPSLPERYREFLAQRIEEYKERMPRQELLTLGDAALEQLRTDESGQLSLNEVVLRDHVNHLIQKDLKLPSFRAWKNRFLRLRSAQRQPTHWGLPTDQPVISHTSRLETEVAIVIGIGAAPYGFLMAAHDARVIIVDGDIGTVETAEHRASKEWLDAHVETLVVDLARCPGPALESMLANVPRFDGSTVGLVILDPHTLGQLPAARRTELVDALKGMTVAGGTHLMPSGRGDGTTFVLAPDALHVAYSDWISQRAGGQAWFISSKPDPTP